MSISTVVTRGFGSFGSVNYLPTWGYDIGAAGVDPANLTTRLALVGTSMKRMAVEGTSVQRLATVGTSQERLTIEGASR